jgi:hypothetical protein
VRRHRIVAEACSRGIHPHSLFMVVVQDRSRMKGNHTTMAEETNRIRTGEEEDRRFLLMEEEEHFR